MGYSFKYLTFHFVRAVLGLFCIFVASVPVGSGERKLLEHLLNSRGNVNERAGETFLLQALRKKFPERDYHAMVLGCCCCFVASFPQDCSVWIL